MFLGSTQDAREGLKSVGRLLKEESKLHLCLPSFILIAQSLDLSNQLEQEREFSKH